jgi:hypothetical protein
MVQNRLDYVREDAHVCHAGGDRAAYVMQTPWSQRRSACPNALVQSRFGFAPALEGASCFSEHQLPSFTAGPALENLYGSLG